MHGFTSTVPREPAYHMLHFWEYLWKLLMKNSWWLIGQRKNAYQFFLSDQCELLTG